MIFYWWNWQQEKSEKLKKEIRASPDYAQCIKHHQLNTILSHSCIKTRHQSASVDKIKLKVELENEFGKNPAIQDLEDYIKAYFVGQVSVDPSTNIVTPSKEISRNLDLTVDGDEAQLGVERSGQVSI